MLFYAFMSIGGQATNIPSVQKAKEAATDVFSIIDEKSTLDVRDETEDTIHELGPGMIQFKQVTFNYPTRAAKVLDAFNMKIPAGAKVALVGHSGCGKSTITNLLLRFYDAKGGKIKIDGEDLEDYNALSLRRQIGYVMQEPILFNKTIKENILYGKLDATDEEVYKAALNANAIGFIEAGQGELTAEQAKKELEEELAKKFAELARSRPGIQSLQVQVKDYSDKKLTLLLEILTRSDDKILNLINEQPGRLLALLDTYGNDDGMLWEELVIRFEWTFEMQRILDDSSLGDDVRQAIGEAGEKLKFAFNETMVQDWKASLTAADYEEGLYESLARYIYEPEQYTALRQ